jgi:hypothetical protein
MSYVNCARHPREQNLAAIQIDGHIYYEVCCELKPGSELLVWYDTEFYVQFMGVPISIRDIAAEMTSSTTIGTAADSDVKRQQPAVTDDCECKLLYIVSSLFILSDLYNTYLRRYPSHISLLSLELWEQKHEHITVND